MNYISKPTIDPPSWLVVFTSCLIGVWLLGNLLRMTLPIGGATYPHDLLFALLFFFSWPEFLGLFEQIRNHIQKRPLFILAVTWTLLGWVIAWFFQGPVVLKEATVYAARLLLYASALTVLIKKWRENPLPVHLSTKDITIPPTVTLTVITAFFAVFGLLQYLFLPDTRFLAVLGWDDHYHRLLSTQLDPNFAGLLLVLSIFVAVKLPKTVWKYIALSIFSLALVLTWSRASWLAAIAGALHLTYKHAPKKLVLTLFIALISLTTLYAIPKPAGEGGNLLRTSTIAARLRTATHWLQDLQPYQWVVGKGLFVPTTEDTTFATTNNARLPDAWPITFMVGTGIVGTLLWIATVLQHKKYWNTLLPYQQACVVAVLVHGIFNNSLTQPFVFIALITVIFSASKINK